MVEWRLLTWRCKCCSSLYHFSCKRGGAGRVGVPDQSTTWLTEVASDRTHFQFSWFPVLRKLNLEWEQWEETTSHPQDRLATHSMMFRILRPESELDFLPALIKVQFVQFGAFTIPYCRYRTSLILTIPSTTSANDKKKTGEQRLLLHPSTVCTFSQPGFDQITHFSTQHKPAEDVYQSHLFFLWKSRSVARVSVRSRVCGIVLTNGRCVVSCGGRILKSVCSGLYC